MALTDAAIRNAKPRSGFSGEVRFPQLIAWSHGLAIAAILLGDLRKSASLGRLPESGLTATGQIRPVLRY